jgi:hypothetical protein
VIEINGQDLRRQPIEDRKLLLKELLRKAHPGIAYNRHFDVAGGIVFHHACKLGCEGIVSKRLASPYTSGRVNDWLKIKNPSAPAERREARVLIADDLTALLSRFRLPLQSPSVNVRESGVPRDGPQRQYDGGFPHCARLPY